jgi:hypothetical protein
MTWALLIALVKRSPRAERLQVAALVLVASAGEVLGSLVLGLYAYRRGGIPAFVPPGRGLVYIGGARLAQRAVVRAHARASVNAVASGGALWALATLVLARPTDVAGALAMVALLAFLARGRRPDLFAACSWSSPSSTVRDPDGRLGVAGAPARAAARHGQPAERAGGRLLRDGRRRAAPRAARRARTGGRERRGAPDRNRRRAAAHRAGTRGIIGAGCPGTQRAARSSC